MFIKWVARLLDHQIVNKCLLNSTKGNWLSLPLLTRKRWVKRSAPLMREICIVAANSGEKLWRICACGRHLEWDGSASVLNGKWSNRERSWNFLNSRLLSYSNKRNNWGSQRSRVNMAMTFEEALDQVGSFGRFQYFLIFYLCCLVAPLRVIPLSVHIFTLLEPPHWYACPEAAIHLEWLYSLGHGLLCRLQTEQEIHCYREEGYSNEGTVEISLKS